MNMPVYDYKIVHDAQPWKGPEPKCPKCESGRISVYPEWVLPGHALLLDPGCDAKCRACNLVGIVDEFMVLPVPLEASLRPPEPVASDPSKINLGSACQKATDSVYWD